MQDLCKPQPLLQRYMRTHSRPWISMYLLVAALTSRSMLSISARKAVMREELLLIVARCASICCLMPLSTCTTACAMQLVVAQHLCVRDAAAQDCHRES